MAVSNLTITSLATSEFQDTVNANAAIGVKNSSGTMYVVEIDNSANGSPVFTKLYDSNGSITVGTSAPDWIIKVPANTNQPVVFSPGVAFSSGLQVATVTAGGTAGVTSPASPVIVRVVYT